MAHLWAVSRCSVRWCICWLCNVLNWFDFVFSSLWDSVSSSISAFSCVGLCVRVCVLLSCLRGAEGPGSFLLYLFGQESFVPLGLRWPLPCLSSKPTTRMIYKYITQRPNEVKQWVSEYVRDSSAPHVEQVFLSLDYSRMCCPSFFLSRLCMITERIASSAAISGKKQGM